MNYRVALEPWPYGDSTGWEWTSGGRRYRTDSEGSGKWYWNTTEHDWKQTSGTCQFSLPVDRQAALRDLRRQGIRVDRYS